MTDRFGYNTERNNPLDLTANALVQKQLDNFLADFNYSKFN
jgi:hypothetical protein